MKDFIAGHPLHYASDTCAAALRGKFLSELRSSKMLHPYTIFSEACWDTAQPTVERKGGTFGTEARLTLGSGLIQIFQVMPREHQPRLLEELVTSSISRLNNASLVFSSTDRNTVSPTQLYNVADDIILLSGLTKEFLLSTSSINEDMADDHQEPPPPNSATDVLMASHVVSLIRNPLPAVLFLTKTFLCDEVCVCSIV